MITYARLHSGTVFEYTVTSVRLGRGIDMSLRYPRPCNVQAICEYDGMRGTRRSMLTREAVKMTPISLPIAAHPCSGVQALPIQCVSNSGG